jgi:O-antigen ligase
LLCICFIIFLFPISVEGMGANYAFMLMPLLCLVSGQPLRRPTALATILLALYTCVFGYAFLFQTDLGRHELRQTISFLLFMGMFAFACVQVTPDMIQAFKAAVVLVSIYFSLESIFNYYGFGGADLSFEVKDLIGSQRYGFVYILALWITYDFKVSQPKQYVLKYCAYAVILTGLLMTFSRASILGLVASLCLYAIWTCVNVLKRTQVRSAANAVVWMMGVAGIAITLFVLFPVASDFFGERLIAPLIEDKFLTLAVQGTTSEGIRLFIWREIWSFVVDHPLGGSGFLGVWILGLFDESNGSAHSQYADVLFRTGFLGFFAYLFVLFRIAVFLAKKEKGLFWGFVSILVYGLFHETFKEPHGGFILAFLLGVTIHAPARARRMEHGRTELFPQDAQREMVCEVPSVRL